MSILHSPSLRDLAGTVQAQSSNTLTYTSIGGACLSCPPARPTSLGGYAYHRASRLLLILWALSISTHHSGMDPALSGSHSHIFLSLLFLSSFPLY